jgi:hypothetical protein
VSADYVNYCGIKKLKKSQVRNALWAGRVYPHDPNFIVGQQWEPRYQWMELIVEQQFDQRFPIVGQVVAQQWLVST